jgi:hypothetical protein
MLMLVISISRRDKKNNNNNNNNNKKEIAIIIRPLNDGRELLARKKNLYKVCEMF